MTTCSPAVQPTAAATLDSAAARASRRGGYWNLIGVIVVGHLALLTIRYGVTGSFVAGDSAWQFATLRSIYKQGSLDLSDEVRFFYEERSTHTGNRKLLTIPRPDPRTGLVTTVWPEGPP